MRRELRLWEAIVLSIALMVVIVVKLIGGSAPHGQAINAKVSASPPTRRCAI